VLDQDEAAVQEEWDSIPDESTALSSDAGASASPAEVAATTSSRPTISYDEALKALAGSDMSAMVPKVVLYEAPSSCFGLLLHCFSRPTLHIRNSDDELLLPFLLALTPFDGYVIDLFVASN
jgi:hypothetical protein